MCACGGAAHAQSVCAVRCAILFARDAPLPVRAEPLLRWPAHPLFLPTSGHRDARPTLGARAPHGHLSLRSHGDGGRAPQPRAHLLGHGRLAGAVRGHYAWAQGGRGGAVQARWLRSGRALCGLVCAAPLRASCSTACELASGLAGCADASPPLPPRARARASPRACAVRFQPRRLRPPACCSACRTSADPALLHHQRISCRGSERTPLSCQEQQHSIGCSSRSLMTVACKGPRAPGTLPACIDEPTLALLLPAAAVRAESPRASTPAVHQARPRTLAAGAAAAIVAGLAALGLAARYRRRRSGGTLLFRMSENDPSHGVFGRVSSGGAQPSKHQML